MVSYCTQIARRVHLCYADDTYRAHRSWREFDLMPSCQPELSNINQRATDNNLRLNPDKPIEIIFYACGRRDIQAEAQSPSPYRT